MVILDPSLPLLVRQPSQSSQDGHPACIITLITSFNTRLLMRAHASHQYQAPTSKKGLAFVGKTEGLGI